MRYPSIQSRGRPRSHIQALTAAAALCGAMCASCDHSPRPMADAGSHQHAPDVSPPVNLKPETDGSFHIGIDNFSYRPAHAIVPAGARVVWVNNDDIPHTVTSPSKPRVLDSKAMDTDEKFEFTFSQPGTFAYFCAIHPRMTGEIVVAPASAQNH